MEPIHNLRQAATLSRFEFENTCKSHTSYTYLGNSLGICQILSRNKLFIDTRDIGVAPHLILDGYWESWITQFIASIVNEGDVCIDAGANFGYYSVLMAELAGEHGKVLAVEPNPRLADLLRFTSNLQSRSFKVIEAALSNKPGKAVLNVPDNYPGSASINKGLSARWGRAHRFKVPVLTLDQLVQQNNLPRVDVIKMDVEGFEPMVLEGMKETLSSNANLKIVMEYTPEGYRNAAEFTNYLVDHFEVKKILGPGHLEDTNHDSIADLLKLKDHVDLYLKKK